MWEFVGTRVTKDAEGREVRDPVEPVPGIGPGPLEDAEFEKRVARYEARFDESQRGLLKASGIYVHKRGRLTRAVATGEDTPEQSEEAANA